MKVRRVDINPHVRTVVFCLYRLISGLSREATLRTVAYVLPLAHTRVRGSCCVALLRSVSRRMRDSTVVATDPAAHNRRYVNDRSSAIPRGTWKSISNRRRGGKRKIKSCQIPASTVKKFTCHGDFTFLK